MASVDPSASYPCKPGCQRRKRALRRAPQDPRGDGGRALFDGHDAAIGVMRAVLQAGGAEVIHLRHNRGAGGGRRRGDPGGRPGDRGRAPIRAATSNTSSTWSTSCARRGPGTSRCGRRRRRHRPARDRGAARVRVRRIFSPEDGGATGLGDDRHDPRGRRLRHRAGRPAGRAGGAARARGMTRGRSQESAGAPDDGGRGRGRGGRRAAAAQRRCAADAGEKRAPVLGITGTGGAGKSSLTDELPTRLLRDHRRSPDRGGVGRSDAATHRRRAARRPQPHERAARPHE